MFNAPIKYIAISSVIAFFAVSCTNKAAENAKKAAILYEQATEKFESKDYISAYALLDSIDKKYPQAFEARKSASQLRPQVMERWSAAQLSVTDSLLVENQILGINLREQLEFVKNPLEGYFVAASSGNVNVRQTPGLHGRISPAFKFYLTASCPAKINSVAVRLEANDESVTSATIPFDGERNNRSGKCETITFTEAESAPLGEFVKNHSSSKIMIVYVSTSQKEHKIAMTDANKNAIITEFSYAQSVIRDKQLQLEKTRLTNQLKLSRQQIARMQSADVSSQK